MNLLVIGNGLSAASVSYFAHEKGCKIFRLYYDDSIGGLCEDKFFPENNTRMSRFGPHIFHTSYIDIWQFVNSIVPFTTYQNSPKALYCGKFYSLPFNLNTMQQVYGVQTSAEARLEIDADREYVEKPSNAEEMAKSVVGKTFYEMFQKSYSEKQWKKRVSEVAPEILARVPIRYTYNDNYFNDLFQGFPLNGYTDFITRIFDKANVEFIKQTCEKFNLEHLIKTYNIDKVIVCDRPDTWFHDELDNKMIPYGCTSFIRVDTSTWAQDAAVVNHCDMSRPYTRTTEYALLTSKKDTVPGLIQAEIPQGELDKYDYCLKFQSPYLNETTACYPTTSDVYKEYEKLLTGKGIILCGRLAENKYLNMDQAIVNAREKVYNILGIKKECNSQMV